MIEQKPERAFARSSRNATALNIFFHVVWRFFTRAEGSDGPSTEVRGSGTQKDADKKLTS